MTSEDFFDRIQEQYSQKLPFVVYRKPNEAIVKSILQSDATLHSINDYTESGFVFAPFDDKLISILIPLFNSTVINAEFFPSDDFETSKKPTDEDLKEKSYHIQLVQKGIDAIIQNEFQKVVLSRKVLVNLDEANPLSIFKNLLKKYESAFVYCWYHPKVGCWLGATPETLLTIEGRNLTTMALAGTQKFNGTLNVVWQNKERQEQQFVTDFIVDSLQDSFLSLQVSKPETVKAGTLLHLKTNISARLKTETLNLKQIIKNLHPTPAVCGLPKQEAKQFILKNENYGREFYTGFLGELNLKEQLDRSSHLKNQENKAYKLVYISTQLFVNLRCMKLDGNIATLYVGGGITQGSDPEKEWEETVEKSKTLLKVILN